MNRHPMLAVSIATLFFVFMLSSCRASNENMDRFPIFPVVAPITVLKLDAVPARKLCEIEGERARAFISTLSVRYPDGWRAATSFVSLAPSYRIVIGATEILILKMGMAISISEGGKNRSVVVHQLELGEAETLVKLACPQLGGTG